MPDGVEVRIISWPSYYLSLHLQEVEMYYFSVMGSNIIMFK